MGTKQVKNVDGPIISYSEDSGKGLIQKGTSKNVRKEVVRCS